MQKLLDTSSALYPTGLATQRKIFRVPAPILYRGRAAALYQKTAGTIVLVQADPPYSVWSASQNIVSDSADFPFSAVMDSGGNIYFVYTQATTLALLAVKLTFSNGAWTVGTVRQVLTADSNYYPVIAKDRTDRLWIVWSRLAVADGKYYLQAKSSINDGVTWGSGSTDIGTTLTSGSTSVYGQVEIFNDRIYAFYADGGTKLANRYFAVLGSVWSAEEVLATGTGFDFNFAVGSSTDGKLGTTYVNSLGHFYKEYDGAVWSGALQIDTGGASPLLTFPSGKATVLYLKTFGAAQNQLVYSQKGAPGFDAAVPLFAAEAAFAKVFVYDASATVKFQDKTSEAASTAVGDVLHSTSGAMLKDVGDALYLGADEPFHFFRTINSVAGIAGVVSYSYWNGSEWAAFTPYSGNYNFADTGAGVYLWADKSQIPSGWLKSSVSGVVKFHLKIEVSTNFSTGPVGSQLSAIPETLYPNVTV